jgi:branched-chain amino acid transport system permease protein
MKTSRVMRLPVFANTGPRDWVRFLVIAALLAALPLAFPDPFFILVFQSLAYLFIVALGLDFLVGWTGQVSLGHAGLYAIGAYTTALLSTRAGWSFWVSAPMGVTFAGVAGALLAIPSLRAKGPHPAMVTLARVHDGGNFDHFRAHQRSHRHFRDPAPMLPGGEEMTPAQCCWLILTAALLCQLLANNLLGARIGRTRQAAARSRPRQSASTYRWKVLAFVISSLYAGLAGSSPRTRTASSATPSCSTCRSPPSSAVLMGAAARSRAARGRRDPESDSDSVRQSASVPPYINGGIILVTIIFLPDGRAAFSNAGVRHGGSHLRRSKPTPFQLPAAALMGAGEARGLIRDFGGNTALDRVDIAVRPGFVHGLIGPNGSGKSTLMKILAGLYPPSAGEVLMQGKVLTRARPHRMARLGVTRTFQSIRLFGDLSVLDHVMVGFHLHLRAGVGRHLLQTSGAVDEEQTFRRRAMGLLQFVGIAERAHERPTTFPTVSSACSRSRALAIRPRLLLLDEPPPVSIRPRSTAW